MLRFIKKISAIAIIIFVLGILCSLTAYLMRGRILNYKIPAEKHIVFVGNSQFEMGINDSILVGSKNVAKSAKQYLFMRIDIENLLSQNPQIDTVFLVVSPFSLRESDADRSYEDNSYIESVTYYTPYMSIDDLKELPISLPFIKDMYLGGCLKYLANPQECGGYIFNTRDDMKADKIKLKREELSGPVNIQNGNDITLHQLSMIGKICKDANVKLIYLSTPNWDAHNKYDISLFRKQVVQLQKNNNADYWDYVDYPLADSCYADMTHLNWKGAREFTNILKIRLQTNIR